MTVEHVEENGYEITRFQMQIGDEVWPVSINHTIGAVKVNGVVLRSDAWEKIARLPPDMARAAVRTMAAFDGELTQDAE